MLGGQSIPISNPQGRKFAENKSYTGWNKFAGMAPIVEGQRGDLHVITGQLPVPIAVGTDGSPFGSTTSANGASAILIDPLALGGDTTIAVSQCERHMITKICFSRELVNGNDATTSKGRLAIAIAEDPGDPLYGAETYAQVLVKENSAAWSLNEAETTPAKGYTLEYKNNNQKLHYTQWNGTDTKSTEADLRDGASFALIAAVEGAFVPGSQGAVVTIGYINFTVEIATYGRTTVLSPASLEHTLAGLVSAVAADRYFSSVERRDDAVQPVMRGISTAGVRSRSRAGYKEKEVKYSHPFRFVPRSVYNEVLTEIIDSLLDKFDADYEPVDDNESSDSESENERQLIRDAIDAKVLDEKGEPIAVDPPQFKSPITAPLPSPNPSAAVSPAAAPSGILKLQRDEKSEAFAQQKALAQELKPKSSVSFDRKSPTTPLEQVAQHWDDFLLPRPVDLSRPIHNAVFKLYGGDDRCRLWISECDPRVRTQLRAYLDAYRKAFPSKSGLDPLALDASALALLSRGLPAPSPASQTSRSAAGMPQQV